MFDNALQADKIKTGQQVLSFSIGEIVELYIKAFRVLNNMFDRCSRENNHGYARYGGRGIYVDERWIKDPQCQVSYKVLNSRLKKGMPLATALKA